MTSVRLPWFPISASPRDGLQPIGTAFLVEKGERLFLVTAAHVPVEAQPTSHWTAWPADLWIFRPDGHLPIPLFDGAGPGRKPRFVHAARDGDYLQDFLAMEVDRHLLAAGQMLGCFLPVPAGGVRLAVPGEVVTGRGYPHLCESWPAAVADQFAGPFVGYHGLLAYVDAPVRKGHSGGPAFLSDDTWLGMTIGSDYGPGGVEWATIVPAHWILAQL